MKSVDQIEFAKEFASKKFKETGVSNHWPDVLAILQDEFGINDQNLLTAAILHDTLEDTGTTYNELKETFSKDVADLVEEVSHPKNYNHDQRIQFYEKLKSITLRAKMIKMADFTSHLRSFTKIYERKEQHLYPKFVNNDKYIASIREFLESCEESDAKKLVFGLVDELESLL